MSNFLFNLTIYTLASVMLLIVIIYIYYQYAFCYWKNLNMPHLKPSFPFGNFDSNIMDDVGGTINKIYKRMKDSGLNYCGYYIMTIPVFMPISPKLIKQILTTNFKNFHDRGLHCDEENDPMGASILTYNGEKWRNMRTKLTPIYSSGKLKMLFPIIINCGRELENVLEEAISTSEPIDIYEIASRYTTDIICSTAFGLESNSLKNPDSEYRKYGRMMFCNTLGVKIRLGLAIAAPIILKMFKISLFNSTAGNFFHKVVMETVHYRETNKIHRDDLMNLLIKLKNNENIDDGSSNCDIISKDSEGLSMNQIAAQCFLFFAAGFETVSVTIKFCMYELAVNPEIQNITRQEVINVLQKYNGEFTYEAISEMRYLDNVLNETIRKYPPIYMINRICTEDFQIPEENIVIKKGTRAVISVFGIHWDEENYPNPSKFDPDRFSDEEKAKRLPFTYIPFGVGPRICPGMRFGILEFKTIIAAMIKNYNFKLHPKMKVPLETSTVGALLTSADPILLLPERL